MPAGPTPEELERAKRDNNVILDALMAQLEYLPRGSRIVINETGNYELIVAPRPPHDDSLAQAMLDM